MIPQPDPVVVYAMVTALIVVLCLGIVFASPLRTRLTGPDTLPDSADPAVDDERHAGPWSTAVPQTDDNWPARPTDS